MAFDRDTGILTAPFNLVSLSQATGNPILDVGYQCSDSIPFFQFKATFSNATDNDSLYIKQHPMYIKEGDTVNVYIFGNDERQVMHPNNIKKQEVDGILYPTMVYLCNVTMSGTGDTLSFTITNSSLVGFNYTYRVQVTNNYYHHRNIRIFSINKWAKYKPIDIGVSNRLRELTADERLKQGNSHLYGVDCLGSYKFQVPDVAKEYAYNALFELPTSIIKNPADSLLKKASIWENTDGYLDNTTYAVMNDFTDSTDPLLGYTLQQTDCKVVLNSSNCVFLKHVNNYGNINNVDNLNVGITKVLTALSATSIEDPYVISLLEIVRYSLWTTVQSVTLTEVKEKVRDCHIIALFKDVNNAGEGWRFQYVCDRRSPDGSIGDMSVTLDNFVYEIKTIGQFIDTTNSSIQVPLYGLPMKYKTKYKMFFVLVPQENNIPALSDTYRRSGGDLSKAYTLETMPTIDTVFGSRVAIIPLDVNIRYVNYTNALFSSYLDNRQYIGNFYIKVTSNSVFLMCSTDTKDVILSIELNQLTKNSEGIIQKTPMVLKPNQTNTIELAKTEEAFTMNLDLGSKYSNRWGYDNTAVFEIIVHEKLYQQNSTNSLTVRFRDYNSDLLYGYQEGNYLNPITDSQIPTGDTL